MLRGKDKSQSKQWHAKRMVGSWPCTDALSICQPVNLSLSFACVSLNALPTQSQNCALVLLRWRTQSCPLTSGCCPGAQRPQKGVAFTKRSTRSCWVRHRTTACGLQLPFAAAVATKSSRSLMPARPTFPHVSWTIGLAAPPKLLHLLRFSSIYSNSMVPLSVWAPHTDVDPLSLQHTWKPSDSIKDGTAQLPDCSARRYAPVVELKDVALHVRVSPRLFEEPLQRTQDRPVWSCSRSSVLATVRVVWVTPQ